MKDYTVTLRQYVYYEVSVSAENEKEAVREAIRQVSDDDIIDYSSFELGYVDEEE